MLGNYVNAQDVTWAVTRLPSRLTNIASRATKSGKERTIQAFSGTAEEDQWWVVPAVQRRWNGLITGDARINHVEYLAGKYLAEGNVTGLSVGCGSGEREVAWARTGRFKSLVGIDLTPAVIDNARSGARSLGLDDVLDFRVADLTVGVSPGEPRFDVVIGEHAIHHFAPLHLIIPRMRDEMKPGGLLLIDEYVGPRRFQWTDAQYECANGLLALLPERLRQKVDGTVKRRVDRPSIFRMRFKDPSEAVESDLILPLLDRYFEQVELRPYGGTVIHIVLSEIAHNFASDDPEADELLQAMFEVEDALLRTERLSSDFVVGVYRKS